jgi:peptide/nickel transport system permease protein
MPVARLVRAQFLSLREKEFVEAARARGDHVAGPGAAAHPAQCARARHRGGDHRRRRRHHRGITLSFLGLGFPPDIPTWGRLLFDAKDNLDFAPHWALAPGLAIFLTVVSINFVGDGLRDAMDPRHVP